MQYFVQTEAPTWVILSIWEACVMIPKHHNKGGYWEMYLQYSLMYKSEWNEGINDWIYKCEYVDRIVILW